MFLGTQFAVTAAGAHAGSGPATGLAAYDALTEEEITNTVRDISMSKDQISILIAHRLSTILHADLIHVMEKGTIVETGSHDDLLEQKGLYYAMWRQQIGERRDFMGPRDEESEEEPPDRLDDDSP